MISVKDIVTDKDFIQKITHYVFEEDVDDNGRTVFVTRKSVIEAVITIPQDSEMIRWVDRTSYTQARCITTKTILNPPSTLTGSDEFDINGNRYVIVGIDDYRDFGYNRAFCTKINLTDSRSTLSKMESK